jgi:hypothetical protein
VSTVKSVECANGRAGVVEFPVITWRHGFCAEVGLRLKIRATHFGAGPAPTRPGHVGVDRPLICLDSLRSLDSNWEVSE